MRTYTPRYSEVEVRDAVEGAHNVRGALRRLGLPIGGANYRTLKRLIAHYGISTAHFDPYRDVGGEAHGRRTPLSEVLVRDSAYDRTRLKQRLYAEGLKERRCELCGQGEEWRGRMMSLIIDHINGVGDDNRLENLQIVCPNCAATLDTHCGRKNRIDRSPRPCLLCGRDFVPNRHGQRYCSRACGMRSAGPRDPHPERRKVTRPPYERLMAELRATNYSAVARQYGVSDNAVRKWVRWYQAHAEEHAARDAIPSGDGADSGDAPASGGPRGQEHPTRETP